MSKIHGLMFFANGMLFILALIIVIILAAGNNAWPVIVIYWIISCIKNLFVFIIEGDHND